MSTFLFYIFGDPSSTLEFVAGPLIVLICMRNVLNFMDSSIVLFVVVFIHCFRADSSTLITGDSSPLF